MNKLIYHETGQWSDSFEEKYDINYSGILTKLIKEAAKCEYLSSDLFYTWHRIVNDLHQKDYKGGMILFGFRERGIDSTDMTEMVIKQGDWSKRYRVIYKLIIEVKKNTISMSLYQTWEQKANNK